MSPGRAKRDPLVRVEKRPRPEQWVDDEPMTLVEAAAVFFPEGPLTVASLRTTIRRGELAYVMRAGKMLTTPGAMRDMMKPQFRVRGDPPDRAPSFEAARVFTAEDGKAAQERGRKMIAELRASLRPKRRKPAP